MIKEIEKTKCPKCGEEIEELKTYEEMNSYLRISDSGEADYTTDGYLEKEEYNYECPECHEVLFDNEQDAIDFLKGKLQPCGDNLCPIKKG